jgi:benzodiazapine receptor
MSLAFVFGFSLINFTPLIAGFSSAFLTMNAVQSNWYRSLQKPFFQPPSWLFGPVWSFLYLSMGYSSWRIISKLGFHSDSSFSDLAGIVWESRALHWFGAQLLLNFFWSEIFFNRRQLIVAGLEISLMWVLLVKTIYEFETIDSIAALLLYPLLAWVSFASLLNWCIALMNLKKKKNK